MRSPIDMREALAGGTTSGIDLDHLCLAQDGAPLLVEALRCQASPGVTPLTSHPVRYIARNAAKFAALAEIAQRAQAEVALLNYATEDSPHAHEAKAMRLVGAWAGPRPAIAAPERLRTSGNPGLVLKEILRDAASPHAPDVLPHALFAFLRADGTAAPAEIDRLEAAVAAAVQETDQATRQDARREASSRLAAAAKIPPRRPDLATPELLAEMRADLRALVAETPFWTASGTAAHSPSKALGLEEDRFGDWARCHGVDLSATALPLERIQWHAGHGTPVLMAQEPTPAQARALWSVARRLRAGLVVVRSLPEVIVATDVRAVPGPGGGLHGPDTGTMTRAAAHGWARALDAQGRGAPWSQGPGQFLRRALDRCQQAVWGDSRREEALCRALGMTRRPSGDDDRRRNAEILAPLDPWPGGLPALARHWPESARQARAR
jgi:hypothetical protein